MVLLQLYVRSVILGVITSSCTFGNMWSMNYMITELEIYIMIVLNLSLLAFNIFINKVAYDLISNVQFPKQVSKMPCLYKELFIFWQNSFISFSQSLRKFNFFKVKCVWTFKVDSRYISKSLLQKLL